MMRTIIRKLWRIVTHVQVLSVFIAFALMVFISYHFMSDIIRRNLLRDVENAIQNTQNLIEADFLEPAATVSVVADNVRSMIIRRASDEDIKEYLTEITEFILKDERMMSYANGFYGFFNAYNDKFISGTGWIPPEGYEPRQRPWYKAAVNAFGSTGISEPYIDMMTGEVTITFSRQIFDVGGNQLGIICHDVMLDRISEFAINTYIAKGSYGILLDKNFDVLAHPHPDFIGKNVSLMNDGVAIKEELLRTGEVSERIATDYNGNESVLFVRKLNNGWYLAVLTYSKDYYQQVQNVLYLLIVIASIMAVGLSIILLSIVNAKKKVEERTQIMIDAAPVGITMWDRDYNLVDFNYEAVRVLGLTSKSEYRTKFFELVPEYQPDGRKSFEVLSEFVTMVFNEGKGNRVWYNNDIYGETIPFDAQAFRIKHNNDYNVIVYCRDLREINEAMAKIREADERTQIMLDAVPLCANFWNTELKNIDCNKEAVKLFGLSSKEEYLEGFHGLSPEYQPDGRKSREKSTEFLKKAFEEGYTRFEWLHRKKTGELIPCEVTLVRVEYKNRNIVCGYTRDLRELKTMLSKMREADECTQILFNTTPLSCFMVDKNIQIQECNQEIVRLFGLSDKQEYIEKADQLSPEYQPNGDVSKDKLLKFIDEAFEDGYCRFEWMHQKLDGEQIPTEISLVRVKFKGEYAVAGYIRDLRELKAMIAEMRRAEIAEESSKAKSDFLAKMSHEIRTPMNAILGITEIQLQDNSIPLSIKEALERIYNSGDLLLGIINDILDLSKIESGKFELTSNPYEVASLIHDSIKLNLIRYENKPIVFKLNMGETVPATLIGDELRIKQILNNVLSNAFKYTHEGTIEMSIFTEPLTDSGTVKLIFRVTDTGQGMTAEQVKMLGEKFSRFNMEANRRTEGTGLGMNITRNLIQLMNGELFVESTPGLGSTFTVHLPQVCNDITPIGAELADNLMKLNIMNTSKMRYAQITQEYMPYGRVLIVDDVETNLYVARGLLAPYGLSIETALSGFEAVEKIRSGANYNIIFMDHMMPRMDGIEAVKIIRSLGYLSPIVALTANALSGQAEVFLNNGFNDFISKPIDIRQLNNALNKYIRDKQSPEVLEEARKQRNTMYAQGNHRLAIDPQLAEFFVKDAERAASVLETISENNCRRADDLNTFIINIHAMKSALSNIGESELSLQAAQLEQAGRDQDTKLILQALPEFLKALKNVITKHKPHDDTHTENESNENPGDPEYLQEQLIAIQKACENLDKKAAKEAIGFLRQKTWSKQVRDKLSTISEHLLHSEFDEVARIAKETYFS